MTQFTTTNLVGDRVLVRGTDFLGTEGSTVLDASQWKGIAQHETFNLATEEFDAAVKQFFAPITAAAEKAKNVAQPVEDPLTFVVMSEAVEGVAAKPAHVVKLTRDSIILRILEGDLATDMLAWVGDSLEVLAADQTATLPFGPTAAEVGAEVTGIELDEV